MGTFDAGLAVETLNAEVRPEGDPPVGLNSSAALPQHPGDGGLQIVVADLGPGDPAQGPQCVDVAFEKGFLAAGGEHASLHYQTERGAVSSMW